MDINIKKYCADDASYVRDFFKSRYAICQRGYKVLECETLFKNVEFFHYPFVLDTFKKLCKEELWYHAFKSMQNVDLSKFSEDQRDLYYCYKLCQYTVEYKYHNITWYNDKKEVHMDLFNWPAKQSNNSKEWWENGVFKYIVGTRRNRART